MPVALLAAALALAWAARADAAPELVRAGGANDPDRNAQDLGSLLGKILRIHPSGAVPGRQPVSGAAAPDRTAPRDARYLHMTLQEPPRTRFSSAMKVIA